MSDGRAPLPDAQAERLERYRAGRMDPAEREAFEREALADDALAEALYSAEALAALARRRRRAAAPWRELALAAALLAVFTVAWWGTAERERPIPVPVRRGDEPAVRLLAPAGDVAGPPARFTWTSDALAAGYRFELVDVQGRVVATRVVRDTSLAAADLGVAVPAAGHWSVVPIAADGAERPAPPVMHFAVSARCRRTARTLARLAPFTRSQPAASPAAGRGPSGAGTRRWHAHRAGEGSAPGKRRPSGGETHRAWRSRPSDVEIGVP